MRVLKYAAALGLVALATSAAAVPSNETRPYYRGIALNSPWNFLLWGDFSGPGAQPGSFDPVTGYTPPTWPANGGPPIRRAVYDPKDFSWMNKVVYDWNLGPYPKWEAERDFMKAVIDTSMETGVGKPNINYFKLYLFAPTYNPQVRDSLVDTTADGVYNPPATQSDKYLARVREVAQYALNKGAYVEFCFYSHHQGGKQLKDRSTNTLATANDGLPLYIYQLSNSVGQVDTWANTVYRNLPPMTWWVQGMPASTADKLRISIDNEPDIALWERDANDNWVMTSGGYFHIQQRRANQLKQFLNDARAEFITNDGWDWWKVKVNCAFYDGAVAVHAKNTTNLTTYLNAGETVNGLNFEGVGFNFHYYDFSYTGARTTQLKRTLSQTIDLAQAWVTNSNNYLYGSAREIHIGELNGTNLGLIGELDQALMVDKFLSEAQQKIKTTGAANKLVTICLYQSCDAIANATGSNLVMSEWGYLMPGAVGDYTSNGKVPVDVNGRYQWVISPKQAWTSVKTHWGD